MLHTLSALHTDCYTASCVTCILCRISTVHLRTPGALTVLYCQWVRSIHHCSEESPVARLCTRSRDHVLATISQTIIWAPFIPLINRTELHQTIYIHGILIQASQLRNGIDCTFAFGSDEKPFSGGQCVIFVVEYADGTRCAFRLPYHSRGWKTHYWFWSNELNHWRDFMRADIPLIPRIVGSSLSTDNAIGFPFVAYEWMVV
jgi:hypothetical protein